MHNIQTLGGKQVKPKLKNSILKHKKENNKYKELIVSRKHEIKCQEEA